MTYGNDLRKSQKKFYFFFFFFENASNFFEQTVLHILWKALRTFKASFLYKQCFKYFDSIILHLTLRKRQRLHLWKNLQRSSRFHILLKLYHKIRQMFSNDSLKDKSFSLIQKILFASSAEHIGCLNSNLFDRGFSYTS